MPCPVFHKWLCGRRPIGWCKRLIPVIPISHNQQFGSASRCWDHGTLDFSRSNLTQQSGQSSHPDEFLPWITVSEERIRTGQCTRCNWVARHDSPLSSPTQQIRADSWWWPLHPASRRQKTADKPRATPLTMSFCSPSMQIVIHIRTMASTEP